MVLVVDTSVFVALERRRTRQEAVQSLESVEGTIAMAAITASELLAGIFLADSPVRRRQREVSVERLFDTVAVLPFDLRVARVHADLWARLSSGGQRIGGNDLQIAATALVHRSSLLTDNLREFERVPGLEVRGFRT